MIFLSLFLLKEIVPIQLFAHTRLWVLVLDWRNSICSRICSCRDPQGITSWSSEVCILCLVSEEIGMICFALLNGTFFNGRMFVSIFFWGILLYTTRFWRQRGTRICERFMLWLQRKEICRGWLSLFLILFLWDRVVYLGFSLWEHLWGVSLCLVFVYYGLLIPLVSLFFISFWVHFCFSSRNVFAILLGYCWYLCAGMGC